MRRYFLMLTLFSFFADKYLTMSLNEKRKIYKCGSNYVTLDKIEKWPNTAAAGTQSSETFFKVNSKLNEIISIYTGDICRLEIDSVVNAANAQLAGGAGSIIILILFVIIYE